MANPALWALFFLIQVPLVVMIIWATRLWRRHRRSGLEEFYPQFRRPDIEAVRPKKVRPVMSSEDVDRRFPTVGYSAWKSAHETPSQASAPRASAQLERTTSRDNDEPEPPNKQTTINDAHQNEPPSPDSDSYSVCAICVDQFDANDEVRPLSCGHIFHPACIDMWLTKRQACCPLCKTVYAGLRVSSESNRDGEAEASTMPEPPAAAVVRGERIPRES
ncbi:hypothetical protein P170DRAFT_439097 [Aspergillus steynii IBT 23096]|uniref:RING-type domain-containing protein n=1 Tax=Aspergillus steynii IBT 23096 TaxID=1392250 RepID=A0A2I2G3I9_9EURO|nr:uncharacterized protein P170DRAFT_439097 [Aspergillus steynii IBT 23096]PLB47439.1 hypothetical protein P170DRAFT_439097 [Aspergillus steynii IBT 23096]